MQQAKILRNRLLKAIKESSSANNDAITTGMCEDISTYRYMVGVSETLKIMEERVEIEYQTLYKELFGAHDMEKNYDTEKSSSPSGVEDTSETNGDQKRNRWWYFTSR